jgi:hypothetical protein
MSPSSEEPAASRPANIGNGRAFRNIEKILPVDYRQRARDPGSDSLPLESLHGFRLVDSDGSAMDLGSLEAATSSDALLVMIGEELVYESY